MLSPPSTIAEKPQHQFGGESIAPGWPDIILFGLRLDKSRGLLTVLIQSQGVKPLLIGAF